MATLIGCPLCSAVQAGGGLAGLGDTVMAGVAVTGAATITVASCVRGPDGQPLLPVNATLREMMYCPEGNAAGAASQDTCTCTGNGCAPDRASACHSRPGSHDDTLIDKQ